MNHYKASEYEIEEPVFPSLNNGLDNANALKDLLREIELLRKDVETERTLRTNSERQMHELAVKLEEVGINKKKTRNRRTKQEMEAARAKELCEFKSDGKRKPRPAEPIRSYEDFWQMQNYFWERGRIRDWAMWTAGVALGLRVSDLLNLKVKDVLNDDFSFKERIHILEQKTNKANNCLITEAVVYALKTYFVSINWKINMHDYVFKSGKTGGKMYEEYGWKILSDAGRALRLPIVIGSHTMRKSFANIAACVDNSTIDMNAITKIQGLLNHSDQKVTMRYLGTYQNMFDEARKAVSDFVLGKTKINELVAGRTIDAHKA